MGASTQGTMILTACWLLHPSRSWAPITVSQKLTGLVRVTTGPPPLPTGTPLSHTESVAPAAYWVNVTAVSPPWRGPTPGAGSFEQSSTVVVPIPLGGSPGQSS